MPPPRPTPRPWNSRIEEDLIDQLFNSSERRLARMLLLLSHFGKEGTPLPRDNQGETAFSSRLSRDTPRPITPNINQETPAE
jgi:hypothetical protein